MKTRTKIIGILALLAIAGAGAYAFQHSKPKIGETETVRRGDVRETVSVTGTLEPKAYADLSFQAVGELTSVPVKEGGPGKVGPNHRHFRHRGTAFPAPRSQVALDIAIQEETLARNRLWDDLEKEERQAKKLATEAARQRVRTVATQITNTRLTAPFDGTLTRLDSRAGETVTTGQTVARLMGEGGYIIKADVPESDVAKLAVGMPAQVTFDFRIRACFRPPLSTSRMRREPLTASSPIRLRLLCRTLVRSCAMA
ncbi:MAG: HlyD family efflux transporter periplasmic adaptor subunit [Candidatus Moraniibacteriota bacterium]